MKKIFYLLAILIVFGGAVWFLQKDNLSSQQSANQEKNQISQVAASTSTISQTDKFYNIQANWPQFTGVDNNFNKKIADLINQKISEFEQNASDTWQARKATALPSENLGEYPEEPFDFIADWQAVQINEKYISFVMNLYYFTGGAHGINEINAFNYNVKNQKEITINDFLGSSSLTDLSQLAEKSVTSQIEQSGAEMSSFMTQMIKDGTEATPDNYQNFNFSSDSLIIYFQQYQVAPGSQGPVTISLSKSELEQAGINSSYLQ